MLLLTDLQVGHFKWSLFLPNQHKQITKFFRQRKMATNYNTSFRFYFSNVRMPRHFDGVMNICISLLRFLCNMTRETYALQYTYSDKGAWTKQN